ncbi:hypothetical protein K466DRAFT_607058 [Polyporus arcularius HHB13444]|uniref:Uncharacterized protein n=1 Tax=Polyporus arcularius HHB13444 TaxID=1314778 RepID=A0A5C3NQZ3_9APHY|nr:hypothetical protein K466DRAFT_607058 [Polyporus arcularius HHB13444]
MSYSKLPVSLDDLNKIPRFTASQLVRALLIVIAEDDQVKAPGFDPRVFLCVGCVNRTVKGERMMSFAWPDPNASEEDKLIQQLQHIMYHRPGSPPSLPVPVATCPCHMPRDAGAPPSGSEGPSVVTPPVAATSTTPAPAAAPASTTPAPAAAPDPNAPYIAPPSDSTTWYVVSVGRRVGVFDQSNIVASITDRVPSNSRKCFPTRAAAIQLFEELLNMPGVVRVVDMD